jgi:hypothetical protein
VAKPDGYRRSTKQILVHFLKALKALTLLSVGPTNFLNGFCEQISALAMGFLSPGQCRRKVGGGSCDCRRTGWGRSGDNCGHSERSASGQE